MSRAVTINEIESLKQLKIVRSDNEIFQRLLRSYYGITIENSDYKALLQTYETENKSLSEINNDLHDEISSLREDYLEIEKKYLILREATKNLIVSLKKVQDEQENGNLFDVGL